MVESDSKNVLQAIFSLIPTVQHYEWGMYDETCHVGRFAIANNIEFKAGQPFAEIWMGTHVNGASKVIFSASQERALLSHVIQTQPSRLLGQKVCEKFGDLPFLLKVLSVQKALSIQAHPDKALAEKLHESHPAIYKDSNHKPEIAIALTEFEALCGFRLFDEIASFLSQIPEFELLASCEAISSFLKAPNSDSFKKLYAEIMRASEADVQIATEKLCSRLSLGNLDDSKLGQAKRLFMRLNKQYPNDIGCFSVFLLNYMQLHPGQSIFLAANEPHAYLNGEIIECMATSDNVVRAGLTPKLKDVNVLLEMLSYKEYAPEQLLVKAVKRNKHSLLYSTPAPEFDVLTVELPSENDCEQIDAVEGASIVVCTAGRLRLEEAGGDHVTLIAGQSAFVAAKTPLIATNSGPLRAQAFAAFCDLK